MTLGAWWALSGGAEPARAAAEQVPTTADRAVIDAAIQKAYPTLVRIFCVSEQPSGGGWSGSGAPVAEQSSPPTDM